MAYEARIAAGFRRIYYGINNSSGILIGNTLTGATSGDATGHSLLRLDGAQTISASIPENERVPVLGDDKPMVQFSFPGGELPGGILEMARRDPTFDALCQGKLEEVLGDLNITSYGAPGDQPDMCLLLMREAKKWEGSTKGVGAWENIFIPSCTISPLLADVTQRQHSPYRYGIAINNSARKPWGATFTTGLNGVTEDSIIHADGDYPVMVHTWQGNGVLSAFNLLYTPYTTAKVYAFFNNGVRNPGATVSGKTVTYGAAPASGQYAHAFYEVEESQLS